MDSDLPKVLHPAAGRPLVEWVLDAARVAGIGRIVVVVGHKSEQVRDALGGHCDVSFALQSEQLGTGHAVMMCGESLKDHDGPIVVLNGDMPLIRGESIRSLLDAQRDESAACVVGTARTESNAGLGRIVRDEGGELLRIVEEVDATPHEAAIEEINTGLYAFDGPLLWESLSRVEPANRQGQYYLTDCAEILLAEGHRVVASCSLEISEAMGVNTLEQLAEVDAALLRA
jgi:bifunctional UDP-N-acetylglucosamine pyrophosphorylase/glucosamine-1-phosphate N-acetyltransferase